MSKPLSKAFRSIKPHIPKSPNPKLAPSSVSPSSLCSDHGENSNSNSNSKSKSNSKCPWSVYLILSTNSPIKTYVGVTTNFSRRLKQHNGELKGGAKASRAGRPWVCACTIRGFKDKSEACKFESQWKNCSKKLPRKKKNEAAAAAAADNGSLRLLQHRHSALNKVRDSTDFTHLKVVWKLNPS